MSAREPSVTRAKALNALRIGLASFLLFYPMAVVGTYLGLGVLVAVSRFIAPNQRIPAAAAKAAGPESDQLALAA